VVRAPSTAFDNALTWVVDIPEICEGCNDATSPAVIAATSAVLHDDTGLEAAGIAAKLIEE
jgi:hypothetical protein